MARALPPASFVREAPNNQSAVPVTATRHCPVPVLPRRAKTSFPGREAAPLRFAAPFRPGVPRVCWAGLRSASASAVTLATSTRKQDRRAAPATGATVLRTLPPPEKGRTHKGSVEARCCCCPLCVADSSRWGPVAAVSGGMPPSGRGGAAAVPTEPPPDGVNPRPRFDGRSSAVGHVSFPQRSIRCTCCAPLVRLGGFPYVR
jgi:hypothetical protein